MRFGVVLCRLSTTSRTFAPFGVCALACKRWVCYFLLLLLIRPALFSVTSSRVDPKRTLPQTCSPQDQCCLAPKKQRKPIRDGPGMSHGSDEGFEEAVRGNHFFVGPGRVAPVATPVCGSKESHWSVRFNATTPSWHWPNCGVRALPTRSRFCPLLLDVMLLCDVKVGSDESTIVNKMMCGPAVMNRILMTSSIWAKLIMDRMVQPGTCRTAAPGR